MTEGSALRAIHRRERAKWDGLTPIGLTHDELLVETDLAAHLRTSATMRATAIRIGRVRCQRALDYGCGTGWLSTRTLARAGARVVAIDISPVSVQVARDRALAKAVASRAAFVVAAGEYLPLASESFDMVMGQAVLHHLDAGRGRAELHRVLRRGGRAVFIEPLGANPLPNLARRWLPYPRKRPRGDDRPLSYGQIQYWTEPFDSEDREEIQLLSMLERALGSGKRVPALQRMDHVLLRRMPQLRRFCRYVVLCVEKRNDR